MWSRLVFKNFNDWEVLDLLKDPYFMSCNIVKQILRLTNNSFVESFLANDEYISDIVIWRNINLCFEDARLDVLEQIRDIVDNDPKIISI